MADHIRRQIREAVGSALAGLATTAGRVFQSRVYPLEEADLPGLLIFTESETVSPGTMHPRPAWQRTLQLSIVAVAKATADLDDQLDQICKEVELALMTPVAALDLLTHGEIKLTGTEINPDGTSDQPTGRATMTWEAEYWASAPDVAL